MCGRRCVQRALGPVHRHPPQGPSTNTRTPRGTRGPAVVMHMTTRKTMALLQEAAICNRMGHRRNGEVRRVGEVTLRRVASHPVVAVVVSLVAVWDGGATLNHLQVPPQGRPLRVGLARRSRPAPRHSGNNRVPDRAVPAIMAQPRMKPG